MKLTIVLNTNDPETIWNVLRLAHRSVQEKDAVTVFLLGNGVELDHIQSDQYQIQDLLKRFLDADGEVLACGTCLRSRGKADGSQSCPASNMDTLYTLVKESDKVLTF